MYARPRTRGVDSERPSGLSKGRSLGRVSGASARGEARQTEGELSGTRRRTHALVPLGDGDLAGLITDAAGGSHAALAALYDASSPLVYGLALRILGERAAADDVTIEVFTQAYRQAGTYDPLRGRPLAWLLTITRSRALDRLRAEARRRRAEAPIEHAAHVPSDEDPIDVTVAGERRREVQTALDALTPDQRQAIELAYYGGLTHTEIAARLRLPLGTVKTRIRAAMTLLRARLHPALAEGLA